MKLVYKHQQGGQFLKFFTTYKPIVSGEALQLKPAAKQSTSSKEDKGNFNMKEVLSTLEKVDGLPNELDAIELNVLNLSQYVQMTLDIDPNATNLMYVQIMHDLKIALFNKKEYDKAYLLINKNGGLNEVVIDNGYLYAYDKDKKLTNVSIQEYLKNKDKYRPLTGSNMMWLRAHDPQFANNNNIFDALSNSIGMEEVVKQIKNNLGNLGTDENNLSGYVNKGPGGAVQSGIQQLLQLAEQQGEAAVKGIYKVSTKSKNLTKLAEAAILWIWSTLTPNALSLLMLKGNDEKNPLKGALNLLSLKVMSVMNNSITYDETYLDDFNPDGTLRDKKGKGGGSDNSPKENAVFRYMNGRGLRDTIQILPGGNAAGIVDCISATITDKEDKPFDGLYLSELSTSSFAPILDISNATMGGNKIQNPKQVQLLNNKIHSVFWPTIDGVTPDFSSDTISAMETAKKEIEENGLDSESQEAKQIMAKYVRNGLLRRFSIIEGRTNNSALGLDVFDSNELLQQVDDRIYQSYELDYEEYWSKGSKKAKMGLDKFLWYNPADWTFLGGSYDEVYDGTIWIPHLDNYSNALSGTGDKIHSSVAQEYDQLQYRSDKALQANLNYTNPSEYDD